MAGTMDGSDPSVVAVSAPPKARREGSIYEKYLNIKNNVLADDADHGAAKTCTEISNSTDEQELEAGEVYLAKVESASIRTADDGHRMTSPRNGRREGFRSPRMGGPIGRVSPPRMFEGPGGPLRGGHSRSRSRSRGRNVPGDMNGESRLRSPPRGHSDHGGFENYSSGANGYSDRPPGGVFGGRRDSPDRGAFNIRNGSPRRGGFDGRPGSPRRGGFDGRPGSPPRGGFDGRPVSPLRGGFNGRPGSPPRGGYNGRPGSPRRGGFGGRPGSPRHGGYDGRPGSPPRGGFDGRPGSPSRGGFSGRPGSPLRGGFNRRPGSPPRGGYNGRPGSPRRDGFDGRPGSPSRGGFGGIPDNAPRNAFGGERSPPRGFNGGRVSPPYDGFGGPPRGPRGRSPPRDDFRRGPPMSPGRGCPLGDLRGDMIGGHGPGGPRRSRSRSRPRGPPRSPPRSYNCGPLDRRPGPGNPGRMRPPSPLRNDFGGRGSSNLPPFGNRGPSPIRRPLSPPRGGEFGPRFDGRGLPMNSNGISPGRDGPPNMFSPQGRSRSPNRQPPGEMMRKRDRSWERGGPPLDMVQRPFNGPLPNSPRMMEPGPYDTPSEWSFELKRSGKMKCRCSATSLSVGVSRQLPPYLDVVALPHLNRSPEFLQLERPNVRRVVYELKPESMADASGYREFVGYLIQGRGGHARAGAATEMESQGFKIFLLPPGQAARQLGYKGDHMVAVLRSR